MLKMYNLFSQILKDYSGIILETDGSIRKIQKRAFFHYKKVKKDTPNFTFPMFITSLLLCW